MKENHLFDYILRMADNALIVGQRLGEWCGHGPILEQDMALTNIALDQIGQARSLYQYAGEIEEKGRSEDDLAFLRDVRQFKNLLLVEQPNGDFGQTVARQFFFDAFNYPFYAALVKSKDAQLAAIAEKSLKEIAYHLRWSSQWIIRLGDGTELSHQKIQESINDLWMWTGEMFEADELDQKMLAEEIGVDLKAIEQAWHQKVDAIFDEAGLKKPASGWMQKGGKTGIHTEQLGYILAEMQFLQRAYPGQEW